MPASASQLSTGVRVRRALSIACGAAACVLTSATVAVFVLHPSIVLGDGTFGLSAVPTLLVNAFPYTPLLAIAALILAGTLPAPEPTPTPEPLPAPEPTSASAPAPGPSPGPRRTRRPRRAAMVIALIAVCLSAACIVVPLTVMAVSLLVGLFRFAL